MLLCVFVFALFCVFVFVLNNICSVLYFMPYVLLKCLNGLYVILEVRWNLAGIWMIALSYGCQCG